MPGDSESALRGFLSSRSGGALGALLLSGALALALFTNLQYPPPSRLSEQRCAHVVHSMLQTGDWLVPEVRAKPRLQKPPLFYWAGVGVALLSGDRVSPWSVRAVSAGAALGLALLVFAWGRALAGPGFGLLAAGLLTVMLQFLSSGRRGDAEMLLAFLSAAALFAFDRLEARRRRGLLPAFALAAGLAILTKATAVVLGVTLPILVYLWLRGELRVLRDPGVLASCAAALALGISWYVAVLIVVPGAFDTLYHTLVLPMGGKGVRGDSVHFRPPWWYVKAVPARAAPASLALPFVLWQLWRTRVYRDQPRLRFAALCFLVPFAAFSLLPQKQKHYTLAMLPGLALCSADALRAAARELRPALALFLRAVGAPLALAGLAVTGLFALYFHWVAAFSIAGVLAWTGVTFALLAGAAVAALAARPVGFATGIFAGLLLVAATYRVVGPRVAAIPNNFAQLSLDERERLADLAREHEWFARLLLNAPNPDADD